MKGVLTTKSTTPNLGIVDFLAVEGLHGPPLRAHSSGLCNHLASTSLAKKTLSSMLELVDYLLKTAAAKIHRRLVEDRTPQGHRAGPWLCQNSKVRQSA